jgi:hypothetical protein
VLLSDEEHAALQAAKQEIKGLLSSLSHKNAELDKLAAGVRECMRLFVRTCAYLQYMYMHVGLVTCSALPLHV